MIAMTTEYYDAINASTRFIKAKAELYNDSALVATYTQNDAIKSITIERVGEDSKFFGIGITQKINIKLIDVNREINLTTDNYFKIQLGIQLNDDSIEYISFPKFYITEVNRDENTNELSITAYDVLNKAKTAVINDLELVKPYTIKNIIEAVETKIGANSVIIPEDIEAFDLEYTDGANFEGTEKLQDVLTAAAEATQTIYFINKDDNLVFKRLDRDGEAVKTISRANYITLDSSTNRRLQTICNATELGDNVSTSITEIGSTQYVRDNPFWELREDIADLLEDAKNAICGITINQFNCNWRGDLSLEPGDKMALVTKDNNTVISYLLNDVITYNGGLSQLSEWQYTDDEQSESNPNNLGDAIKQTFAKVDKANKKIDLYVGEIENNSSAISSLQMTTDSINASVQKDLNELTNKVNATMTAEDIKIEIQNELANGTDKVVTKTGFTFDDEGLKVSKTGSEMTTKIDEDGMTVYRDNEEMLKANNEGVIAYNLHAKTYLIVGESSRFEDYEKDGETRTGCFWIGDTEV
jgi:hypothetical protein